MNHPESNNVSGDDDEGEGDLEIDESEERSLKMTASNKKTRKMRKKHQKNSTKEAEETCEAKEADFEATTEDEEDEEKDLTTSESAKPVISPKITRKSLKAELSNKSKGDTPYETRSKDKEKAAVDQDNQKK